MNSNEYLKLLGCLDLEGPIFYLSHPITGGRRSLTYPLAGFTQNDVMVDNIKEAKEIVHSLRCSHDWVILNPTLLVVDGWSHQEYMKLWLEFMHQFRPVMIMAPDWAYSKGCVEEYFEAERLGLNIHSYVGDGAIHCYFQEAALTAIEDAKKYAQQISALTPAARPAIL